ncbi:MAG: tetratricopeptide repeat protein [bacterium]|nr:tetratricopeptide repeat protein [bacterium]
MIDALLGGTVPFVYHLDNLILHLLAGVLLFLFLARLGYRRNLALLCSLVFIAHPLLAQAVAWVPGRNDSLLTIFVLLSFLAFLRYLTYRKWLFLLAHLLLLALALFTKENAIVTPLLILLYLQFIYRKSTSLMAKIYFVILWGAVILPWLFIRAAVLGALVGTADFQIFRSLWQNCPALLSYFGKIFIPFRLSVLPVMRDLPLWPGLLSLSLLVIALSWSKHRRNKYILFGAAWFLFYLSPSLIQSSSQTANFSEHRIYLAFIGILMVCLELDWFRDFAVVKWKPICAGLTLVLLAGLNIQHNRVFQDKTAFWRNAAQTSPSSAFNLNNLGAMYYLAGNLAGAEAAWRQALALNHQEKLVHNNLGLIYLRQGNLVQAEKEFQNELALDPYSEVAIANLRLLANLKK